MRFGSSLRSFGALAEYHRSLLRRRGREAQGPARLGASAVDALGRPGSTPETPGPLAIAFGLGNPTAPARPVGPPRPSRRGRPRAVARGGGGGGVRQADAVESQALTIAASVRALIAFHLRDSTARRVSQRRRGCGGIWCRINHYPPCARGRPYSPSSRSELRAQGSTHYHGRRRGADSICGRERI